MAGFRLLVAASCAAMKVIPGPQSPSFSPKAKHVIVIFLQGGLSQIDSFDYKPLLDKYDGKPLPYETPRTEFATGNLMKSPFVFRNMERTGLKSVTVSAHGENHR